jgi:molybdopterin converting factor small subunit
VQIQVHLFSILRDCLPPDAERGKVTIVMPDGATVGDLIVHLGIDQYLGFSAADVGHGAGWQVMVSGRHESDVDRILHDGEQVMIFPPISGG